MRSFGSIVVVLLLGVGAGIGMAYWRQVQMPWDGTSAPVRLPTEKEVATKLLETAKGGRATVDSLTYYFGLVNSADDEGQTHSHTFTIRNTGDHELTLKPGTTTCQCTSLTVDPTTVAPGGEAKVYVEWHVRNSGGKYAQKANVLTNDPQHGTLEFEISGRVAGELQATPDLFDFASATGGESSEKSVDVVFFGTKREISGHTWQDPATAEYFEFRSEPMTEEELAKAREKEADIQNGYHLFAKLKGNHPNGAIRQVITFQVEPALRKPFELNLSGHVTNELSIIGPGWDRGTGVLRGKVVKEGEGFDQTIFVLAQGDITKPIKVQLKEATPSWLQCEMGEPIPLDGSEGRYRIPVRIIVPKDAPQGAWFGNSLDQRAVITLETDHSTVPTIQIEFRFAINAK